MTVTETRHCDMAPLVLVALAVLASCAHAQVCCLLQRKEFVLCLATRKKKKERERERGNELVH